MDKTERNYSRTKQVFLPIENIQKLYEARVLNTTRVSWGEDIHCEGGPCAVRSAKHTHVCRVCFLAEKNKYEAHP